MHCTEKIVSVRACALARWFCVSRKGETGEDGWGHPQDAVHTVVARLGFEKVPSGPIHALTAWTALENTTLTSQRAGSGKKGC